MMDDAEHAEVRRGRRASTRTVVEAAVDFSNGATPITWEAYRSRMSGNISPWRAGGFTIEESATSEFMAESRPARRY